MKNNYWLQKTAVLFLLGLTFLGFIACSEDKEDEIDYTQLTGLWEGEIHEEGKGTYTALMHFKNDGTVTEYYAITSNGYYADTYTYTLNEGRLRIIDSQWGEVDEYSIRSLTSARLVLYDTYYNEEISYKRYYGNLPSGTQHNADNTNNGYGDGNNNGSNDEESTSINPPTNVQAYVNDGKVTITWQPVSGASSYSVWRSSSSNGSYSPLVYINSSTSYTDNWPSTGYNYYKVIANENIGNGGMYIESDFSSYTSVYVEEKKETPDENEEIPDEKEETPIVKKPNAPTNVTVSNEGNNYYPDVVIRWDEASGADKYYVYRSSSAYGTYSKIATVQWNVYTDDTAPTNKASYYKVTAVNSAGESSYSSYAKFTPNNNDDVSGGNGGNSGSTDAKTKLDAPTNLDYATDLYYVQISFDEVPLAYQYELYRSTKASSGYTKVSASGGSTSGGRYVLTDSNPKSGTTYYKVKAIALSYLGIQDSDYSSYIRVTR